MSLLGDIEKHTRSTEARLHGLPSVKHQLLSLLVKQNTWLLSTLPPTSKTMCRAKNSWRINEYAAESVKNLLLGFSSSSSSSLLHSLLPLLKT
jgi:hypothetical protein